MNDTMIEQKWTRWSKQPLSDPDLTAELQDMEADEKEERLLL